MRWPTRLALGGVLIAAAIAIAVMSCRWGAVEAAVPVLMLPGGPCADGVVAAPWLASIPLGGLVMTILVPMVLLTIAVWLLARGGRADAT